MSNNSKNTQRLCLNLWLNFWEHSTVAELTRVNQDKFISALADSGKSNSTIRRILTVGKAALNHAVEYGELMSFPKIISVKGQDGKRTGRLTVEQAARLFAAAADTPHLTAFLILAFNTLARPGAILELKISQIDHQRQCIQLNPEGREQTKKRRPIVPLTKTLSEWLSQPLLLGQEGNIINWHGKPVKSIKTAFRKARHKAGLPEWVCPYTIRHTMAQQLFDGKVPWEHLEAHLGHTIKSTTSHYVNFEPEKYKANIAVIDNYMEEIRNELIQLDRPDPILAVSN